MPHPFLLILCPFIFGYENALKYGPDTSCGSEASVHLCGSEASVHLCGSEASELNFADNLFARGYYEEAIATYQKFIFYNFASPSLPYARYKLALSYIKRERDVERIKGERILKELASRSDQISEAARFSLIRYYIKEGRFGEAKTIINDLLFFAKDKSKEMELKRLKSIVLLKEHKIEEAKNLLLISGDTGMYRRVANIKLPKKEWLSPLLSALLPGLGEVYCGRYGYGLLSLLINGLSGYGVYHSLKQNKKMDALLILSFLFLRFYQGSIQNAYDFAWEYNNNYLNNRLQGYQLED